MQPGFFTSATNLRDEWLTVLFSRSPILVFFMSDKSTQSYDIMHCPYDMMDVNAAYSIQPGDLVFYTGSKSLPQAQSSERGWNKIVLTKHLPIHKLCFIVFTCSFT